MDSVELLKSIKNFFLTIVRYVGLNILLAIAFFVVVAIGIFIWEKVTGKTYGEDSDDSQSLNIFLDEKDAEEIFLAKKALEQNYFQLILIDNENC